MLDTPHDFTKTENRVSVNDLRRFSQEWLLDCDLRQHSINTIDGYKRELEKIFWFFEHRGIDAVGTSELKTFVSYLANGHNEPGGRWGNPALTKPLGKASMHFLHENSPRVFQLVGE